MTILIELFATHVMEMAIKQELINFALFIKVSLKKVYVLLAKLLITEPKQTVYAHFMYQKTNVDVEVLHMHE